MDCMRKLSANVLFALTMVGAESASAQFMPDYATWRTMPPDVQSGFVAGVVDHATVMLP